MSVTLKQLEAFVWVADLSSFHRAAERLNTTQPNISARIAAIETIIETPLFNRQGGRVRLTAQGQQLLTDARRVLAARDDFLMQANESTLTDGTLRLGVTEMIVQTWLRDFMRVLKDRFPKLLIELTVDMAVNLDRALNECSVDLALINGPFQFPAHGLPLGKYPMVWIAAPSLGLPQKIDRQTLTQHPILTHARGTWPHMAVVDHFRDSRAARIVPSSNLAACLQMTVDGMGVAVIPKAMADRALATGQLMIHDYDWHPKDLEFEARYLADRAPSFVELAAEIAQNVASINQ